MLLQVKDQEFPFNRDLARILVAVEDANDNIPYFTSTVYDAIAYQSSSIGTSVLQVTALDKDNGINGKLSYSLEAGAVEHTSAKKSATFIFPLLIILHAACDWLVIICQKKTQQY